MKNTMFCIAMSLFAIMLSACTGNLSTTDDSTKIEAELPKVEVGEGTPDLDPSTDHDVDIDTPRPGDT